MSAYTVLVPYGYGFFTVFMGLSRKQAAISLGEGMTQHGRALGRTAYEHFRESHADQQRSAMPEWERLKPETRLAWEFSGETIAELVYDSLEVDDLPTVDLDGAG